MRLSSALTATAILALSVSAAGAETVRSGATTASNQRGKASVDYANAKPLPLPRNTAPARSQASLIADGPNVTFPGEPSMSPGGEGDGRKSPVRLFTPKPADDGAAPPPPEFGSSNHVYTTALLAKPDGIVNRRNGKLFFVDSGGSFICSGSLIKKGVVVTAAHCVSRFGQNRFYTNFQFVPAYDNGLAPYGTWTAAQVRVLTSYLNGSNPCSVSGVVCRDDVAVIVLQPQSGAYPGTQTGWHGFGINGYSFASGQAAITQIGWPGSLNNGQKPIRTDSQGSVSAADTNNTVIGSLQTGGSSGGPWVVNYGQAPSLSGGTGFGTAPNRNIVVGVTSWGYVDTSSSAPKEQGASPFLSTNITNLVNASCADFPAACAP